MLLNKNIFKAYDIRGKYPKEINEEIVEEIIYNFAKRQTLSAKHKLKIVVGHDARLSSPALYNAVINALRITDYGLKKLIRNSQFEIIKSGLITTPMLYFLVNDLKADYGIMITASHNPKEYNGLKIVGKNAEPISGKEVLKIISS